MKNFFEQNKQLFDFNQIVYISQESTLKEERYAPLLKLKVIYI